MHVYIIYKEVMYLFYINMVFYINIILLVCGFY
jgi:hypothetical protein